MLRHLPSCADCEAHPGANASAIQSNK